ncbi:hypothetical protein BKI52_45005 [marine bacterium AO1-C]|nr:hypothetical protein BKI52_45005 [marine bacterium AO1-C]
MTIFRNNALKQNSITTPTASVSAERVVCSPQHIEKIRSLLNSQEEMNIRMAFQIAKGLGIPKELHTDLTDSFFKMMVCLEEEVLGPLKSLKKLELFALDQLKSLPESVGQLSQLKMLNLCANALESIPESIGKLQQLQYFNLDSNQLKSLPHNIGKLTQLEWLELGQNKLEKLPKSIGQLQNLRYLNLSHNQLKDLPVALSKLENLTELYLEGNPVSHSLIKHLQTQMPYTRIIA